MFNDTCVCIKCGKVLTDNEVVRIGRDKTLRMCDICWLDATVQIKKISKLWSKLGLS